MGASQPDTPLLNNRYQLQQPLGSGGMAVVYRAQDKLLERPVAIKILREDFSRDEAFRARFHQEAKAVANLSHPNIVTVHDFGLDNSRLFLVLEYMPGTDLKTLIRQRGRFTVDEALSLMVQACAGVGYAHRAGLVHCDLKPHNILVSPDQRVKVTDFGIARALSTIRPDEQTPVVWGSPQYFSPEQANGGAPSPASDVYSLGVVLYELLTGQLPFNASSPTELARLHREAAPPSPRFVVPDLPEDLAQVLLKVLSKEPSHRYRNADQFGRVLIALIHPGEQSAISNSIDIPGESSVDADTHPVETFISPDDEKPMGVDWLTIGLGLLATLAVGGLIPYWLYVWFALNPISR